jgi:sugar O-acyltransferase (sialic acid O-acetyltransferase NeuD family)
MDHARAITLVGGGGHACVVAEAARLAGLTLAGLYDDDPACAAADGADAPPRLGALAEARQAPAPWICCVGELAARRRCLDLLAGTPEAGPVIHPRASVAPSAILGPGVFVGACAVVHTLARVGAHAIINSGAVVEHHCEVGANTHLAPNATLGGAVRIGSDTLVGLGAVVLPGVRIGAGCVVGAGAVLREDLPDGARAVGNPARAL